VTSGVVNIVSFGTEPAPVPDIEIDSIRKIIEARAGFFPNPYLAVEQQVEVVRGSLRGVVGTIVAVKSRWRLVVSVHLLPRSIAVQMDMSMVERYKPAVVTRSSQLSEQAL
jgi:transcription antitermination factor NusG